MGPDYLGLLAGYVAAAGAFWVLFLAAPGIMQAQPVQIQRPWLELLLLAIGIAGVLGVGQLYVAKRLLPEQGEFFQSLNQILIFAPAVAVLVFLRPFWAKNYLPLDRAVSGLGLGLVLALLAFTAFIAASRGIGAWPGAAGQASRRRWRDCRPGRRRRAGRGRRPPGELAAPGRVRGSRSRRAADR